MSLTSLFNKMAITSNISNKESSSPKRKRFDCIICMVSFLTTTPFSTGKCDHVICHTCICDYLQSVLKDGRYTSYERIQCPSPYCTHSFHTSKILSSCLSPDEVNQWWDDAISKSFIRNKVNCPFKNCGAIFDADIQYTRTCTFTECYECRRGFCIACQSSWHPGVIKKVFDDESLKKTLKQAEINEWTRCPKCGHLIEKVDGCTSLRCTCGTTFCYRCGGESRNHSCPNRCERFTSERLKIFRSPMFDVKKAKGNTY
ncbi:MAG: hypothetical protein EXX96DRAFT_625305 [Benjaminiella poitrasii]|nr:MAG: hypothetical protein EXX96DRAFT_625305 [Benjaminiella poitrasii]